MSSQGASLVGTTIYSPAAASNLGTVYLIHADGKLHHSFHYIGWCKKGVDSRIAYHRRGRGSPYLHALTKAGIHWQVVRTWEHVDRNFERNLKNKKNAPRLCPVCRQEGNKVKGRYERIRTLLDDLQARGFISGYISNSPGDKGKVWNIWTKYGERKFSTREVEAFLWGAEL